MKLLFIAAPFPYPPDTGSRNLIYHWLAATSQKHQVHLFALDDASNPREEIPELPNLIIEVFQVIVGRRPLDRILRLIRSSARGIPATSLIFMSPAACSRVRQLVKEGGYDAVILTENVVAGYAPLLASQVPVILFKHSIQAIDAREMRNRPGLYHPRWLLEEWIVRRFEAATCKAATFVCCVNQEDASEISRRYKPARTPEITPIGVELNRFPSRASDPGGKVIVFFGNMTWGANVDAATWFIQKVLPVVWKSHPEARFRVIGPGSAGLSPGDHDSRIIRMGAVPQTDLPAVLADATLGVVPVISGTGVRLKLLEMLSMGIPTVTTSLGRLGTGCRNEEHTLVADDAESFAAAVASLLSNPHLREKFRRAGPVIALQHTWEGTYPRVLHVLETAAQKRSASVAS